MAHLPSADPFQDPRLSVPGTPSSGQRPSSLVAGQDGASTLGGGLSDAHAIGGDGGTGEGALLPTTDNRLSTTLPPPSLQDVPSLTGTPAANTPNPSRPLLPSSDSNALVEKQGAIAVDTDAEVAASPQHTKNRRLLWVICGLLIAAVVIALAVALPVTLVHKKKQDESSSSVPTSNPHSPTGATTGGDGSFITTAGGVTFRYNNSFGGYWVDDPRDPFNNGARAQSFTPALNETWDYINDQIRGVNLGGWLVLEPFIVPALFEKYQNSTPSPALPGGLVVDEWSLSVAMSNDTSPGGGLSQLEDHYKTFITEQDFAEIAGAGLNWVRLPVPYWAVDVWPGEPFLPKTAWNYVLLAIQWARKYGLRMFLELHTAPGSQNGLNHSGRLGPINFLNGPMGIANADRTMGYIRVLAEFISQNEYQDVVQMFGVINEPLMGIIGRDPLDRFYLQSYEMLRDITGIGKGAYMVMHDGFLGLTPWKDFLPGADRLILDTHPYVAFGGGLDAPLDSWPPNACRGFQVNQSLSDFGITITGEFSAAINDCGLWVKGVGNNPSASNCDQWDDWQNWTADMKNGIMQFAMAEMDAMHFPGYFFWTWKIGESSVTGKVESPFWSYKLGYENGWLPTDPRTAIGICDTLGVEFTQPFSSYQPWQTGGSGAGTVAPTAIASLSQYPPPAISNVNGANPLQLPMYTDVSPAPTLPGPTFSGVTTGSGWADPTDTASVAAPIQGCIYPDAWNAPPQSTSFLCGAAAATATPTPALAKRL